MINVRTANLITKVVKKTGRELVVNKDMSILVLRGGFMPRQTVVRGIILMVNAVPLLLLPDVRPIIRLPAIRHADHPVLILADIPVIVAVMIPARQGLLKTITDLMLLLPNAVPDVTDVKTVLPAAGLIPVLMSVMLLLPNAVPDVTDVKTVLPAAGLIPVLMSGLPSAEAAMLVPIPVDRVRSPYLALPIM